MGGFGLIRPGKCLSGEVRVKQVKRVGLKWQGAEEYSREGKWEGRGKEKNGRRKNKRMQQEGMNNIPSLPLFLLFFQQIFF